MFLVISKVKQYLKEKHGLNFSGDLAEILNARFQEDLDKLAARTKGNNRKTARGVDA